MHLAQVHDAGLWRCLCAILRVGEDQCDALAKDAASFPLSMGGLGLRSAVRTSSSAHWASWADSLSMVRERHPGVADMIVDALESDPATPILSAVVEGARVVQVGNFEPPSWASLSHGARPPPREPEPVCFPAGGGNTKQLPAPRWSTVTRGSCPDSRTMSGQCCAFPERPRFWSGSLFRSRQCCPQS